MVLYNTEVFKTDLNLKTMQVWYQWSRDLLFYHKLPFYVFHSPTEEKKTRKTVCISLKHHLDSLKRSSNTRYCASLQQLKAQELCDLMPLSPNSSQSPRVFQSRKGHELSQAPGLINTSCHYSKHTLFIFWAHTHQPGWNLLSRQSD